MSLYSELRRRNVFRVGLFYLVAAWLVVQVAETVLPAFDVPDTFLRGIVIVLAIGFVPALVFAWVFEMTPDGLRRDHGGAHTPTNAATGRKLNWATLAVALLAIGLLVVDRMMPEPPGEVEPRAPSAAVPVAAAPGVSADRRASIAVLPFVDLSAQGDQAYFAEGIAEEILNVLAGVEGLRVASRTSSFLFRNEEKSIPVIAETLGVAHVLEGSVRKAGDRVRVTAQLIAAESDAHLWSQTFDRELSTENLFAIQDEIARAIVRALKESIGLEPSEVAVASLTDNLDAYELYLRATNAAAVMSTESERRQLPLLQKAVELDPDFAEAWAALSSSLAHLPTWDHFIDPMSYRLEAIEAARRALELDPSNETAWHSWRSAHFYLHQWEEADRVAERARQAVPGFAIEADDFLALGYLEKARERAEVMIATASEDRGFWYLVKGLSLEAMGRYEEAIGPIETAILNGYHGSAAYTLADIHLELGRPEVWLMHHSTYYRDHDPALIPLLPHLLALDVAYRAGDAQAGRKFAAIAREIGFTVDDLVQQGPEWGLRVPYTTASALGRDAEVVDRYWSHSPKFWMWTPSLKPFRRSEAFRERVRETGMLDYWRKNGWPDKCRPVGQDDFQCD